jgi:hypothetical protein
LKTEKRIKEYIKILEEEVDNLPKSKYRIHVFDAENTLHTLRWVLKDED